MPTSAVLAQPGRTTPAPSARREGTRHAAGHPPRSRPFQLEAQAAVVDAAPVGGVHVVASQANRAWIAACRSPRVAVSGIFTLRQDGGFCRHPSPRSGHGHPRPKCAYSLAINPGVTDGKHAASQHGHHGRFAKKCHNHNTGLPVPLRVLCRLTRGNRQPYHPAGGWLLPAWPGRKLTGGAARPWHCARPPPGCRAYARARCVRSCTTWQTCCGGRTAASSRSDPRACGRGSRPGSFRR